jgi:hypothetical protein
MTQHASTLVLGCVYIDLGFLSACAIWLFLFLAMGYYYILLVRINHGKDLAYGGNLTEKTHETPCSKK